MVADIFTPPACRKMINDSALFRKLTQTAGLARARAHTNTHTHTRTHALTHARTHARTHTHTHTHNFFRHVFVEQPCQRGFFPSFFLPSPLQDFSGKQSCRRCQWHTSWSKNPRLAVVVVVREGCGGGGKRGELGGGCGGR